jgi:ribonuclease Z
MECFLLGSGGMMPMPYRFLTSLVVRVEGAMYMFDAGEGTQVALKKMALGIKGLRVIAITHLHGDHCLGLPGILMMKAQVQDPGPLVVLGPAGTQGFVASLRASLGFHLNYPIEFVEWTDSGGEEAYADDRISIFWAPLVHTTFCLGYRLEEHPRPGKFLVERARRLRIPEGPLWGRLQRGEEVILADGTKVLPSQVLGPPRRGRSVCFAVDTRPCKALYKLCKKVDMAFLDGMFHPEHEEEAREKGHMTSSDASRVAARAGASRVILVHLSPRYKDEGEIREIQKAASERHGSVEVGRDLTQYTIPLPD